MSRNIHYLCSLSHEADHFDLCQFPAAVTKGQYILDVLKQIPEVSKVSLLSIAQTKKRAFNFVLPHHFQYDDKEEDYRIPSIGAPVRVIRALNIPILFFSVLWYLLFKVKHDDLVIVYHSCSYLTALQIARKIKKFPMIIEAEELYQDVSQLSNRIKKKEYDILTIADSYIFPTQMLDEKLNLKGKPSIICHGTYKVEQVKKCSRADKINHIVYAGTLDPRKGSITVAKIAAFLPPEYHVHIIGLGTNEQINNLQDVIAENCISGHATVSYDGVLSGDEYIEFIQSCVIGLSPQDPDAPFNSTSFPSKILSYLANGLHVVSIRIPAIEKSEVSDLLSYYDEQTPEKIADAIKNVDLTLPYNSKQRLDELNNKFSEELRKMIEELGE